MGFDQEAIDSLKEGAGLLKKVTVTSDSESVEMQSAKDIRAMDEFLTNKDVSCGSNRLNAIHNMFGVSVQRQRYLS